MKLGDYLQLRGWQIEKDVQPGERHPRWTKDGVTLTADEAKLREWGVDWEKGRRGERGDSESKERAKHL